METQALGMIQQMLALTKQGKLRWTKTDYDHFEAEAGEHTFEVEFIYLLRTDEVGSDRTIARLSAFRLLHDYCIGTLGFDLICEMLSIGDPQWTEACEQGRQRFEEGMTFLRNLAGSDEDQHAA